MPADIIGGGDDANNDIRTFTPCVIFGLGV